MYTDMHTWETELQTEHLQHPQSPFHAPIQSPHPNLILLFLQE